MKWTGSISNKNVRMPNDLHAAVKAEAATRGMTVEQAYLEGMSRWLDPGESPFGEISKDEERLLGAVLRFSREAPAEDWLRKLMLPAFIRAWAAKKA